MAYPHQIKSKKVKWCINLSKYSPVAVIIMIWIFSADMFTECWATWIWARYIQIVGANIVIIQRLLFAVVIDRLFHRIAAIFIFISVVGTLGNGIHSKLVIWAWKRACKCEPLTSVCNPLICIISATFKNFGKSSYFTFTWPLYMKSNKPAMWLLFTSVINKIGCDDGWSKKIFWKYGLHTDNTWRGNKHEHV